MPANTKKENFFIMLKKIFIKILYIVLLWIGIIAIEGFRLIGSTNIYKAPVISLVEHHHQDSLDSFHGIGYAQIYYLVPDEQFYKGEFQILGITIAEWNDKDIKWTILDFLKWQRMPSG